jgi:hypothetical protein
LITLWPINMATFASVMTVRNADSMHTPMVSSWDRAT